MSCKHVFTASVLFILLTTTTLAQKTCKEGGQKDCNGKEKWCLDDEGGAVKEYCRDLDCNPSNVDWFSCSKPNTKLTCHKSPVDDQCVCKCAQKTCTVDGEKNCSGKEKWCLDDEEGAIKEHCRDLDCNPSNVQWLKCSSPFTKLTCHKSPGDDQCLCQCEKKVCSNSEGVKCGSQMKWCLANEKGVVTEMCHEDHCDASRPPIQNCPQPGYKRTCEKTPAGDACQCTCVQG